MTSITEIKKLLKENKLIIGKDLTLKALRSKGLEKVFLANNCPAQLKADVEHLASIAEVEVESLALDNAELGDVCKRPHFIAVMGLKKE